MVEPSKDSRGEDRVSQEIADSRERARVNAAGYQAEMQTKIKAEREALVSPPAGSPGPDHHRRHLKFLASRWREFTEAAAGAVPADVLTPEVAVARLGVDQAGLTALTEWEILFPCYVAIGHGPNDRSLLLLRREVEALAKDTTWWRGLENLPR